MEPGPVQPEPPNEPTPGVMQKLQTLQVRFPDEYAWFVLVSSMDLMFTWLILNLGGREANPFANWVYLGMGFNGLVILKYSVVVLVILICELIARLRESTARTLARLAVGISAFPSVWALLLLIDFLIEHTP
ncbi:MAG: DUF5658 family protein [Phycisphaeraceae bacterium]